MVDFFDFPDLLLNQSNCFENCPNEEFDFQEKSLNLDLIDYDNFSIDNNECFDLSSMKSYFMKDSTLCQIEKDVSDNKVYSIKLNIPCHTVFKFDFLNFKNNKSNDIEIKIEIDFKQCNSKRYSFKRTLTNYRLKSYQQSRPLLGNFQALDEGEYSLRIDCIPIKANDNLNRIIVDCIITAFPLLIECKPICQPFKGNPFKDIELNCFNNDHSFNQTLTFKIVQRFNCSFNLKIILEDGVDLLTFDTNNRKNYNSLLKTCHSSIIFIELNINSRRWHKDINRKPLIIFFIDTDDTKETFHCQTFSISLRQFSTFNLTKSLLQTIEPNEIVPLKWTRLRFHNRSDRHSLVSQINLLIDNVELPNEHWYCNQRRFFLPPLSNTIIYIKLNHSFMETFNRIDSCGILIKQFGGIGKKFVSIKNFKLARF